LVVRSFPLFVLAAVLYACCQCGLAAARSALLAGLIEPERRTATRAYLQSAVNAGLAIGAALGGVALSIDTPAAYLAVFAMDAAAFGCCSLVLRTLPPVAPGKPVGGE